MFDTILAYVKRAAAKGDEILPAMRNESLPEEEDLMLIQVLCFWRLGLLGRRDR